MALEDWAGTSSASFFVSVALCAGQVYTVRMIDKIIFLNPYSQSRLSLL